jgi:hypothetical protein
MRKLLASALPFAVFGLLTTVPFCSAQGGGDADFIPAGADMLKTLPGTFFVIGGISVPLHGVPDATGADTIIQRLAAISIPDVIGSSQTINTQMTELNLMSNAGAGPGGTTVFIGLTPGVASLGTLTAVQTINGEGMPVGMPEGTFTSFFDVFFDIRLQAGNQPVACDSAGNIVCHSELTLTGAGMWTDDIPGGFLVGAVIESHPGSGVHMAITNPEPGTFLLFGSGMVLAAFFLKRRLRGIS